MTPMRTPYADRCMYTIHAPSMDGTTFTAVSCMLRVSYRLSRGDVSPRHPHSSLHHPNQLHGCASFHALTRGCSPTRRTMLRSFGQSPSTSGSTPLPSTPHRGWR